MKAPRIVYVLYTNPAAYPPLEHSSTLLADSGWEVLFLGIGSIGSSSLRLPQHDRIIQKQFGGCPMGWRQKFHYAGFVLWSIGWCLRWKPNVIYTSDLLSNPVGWLASFLFSSTLVYHEHDSPTLNTKWDRLWQWFRRKFAKRAHYYVLPNQARLAAYERQCKPLGRGFCIWNCPLIREVGGPREPLDPQRVIILYHGSVNRQRLPISILRAIAALPESVHLQIAGYVTLGHMNYLDELREAAKELGIAERVTILGPIPHRSDLLANCRQGDVGLALMPVAADDINLVHMTGASNKPFDYLSQGLALVVSDLPDWRAMFESSGMAVSCNPAEPASVEAALRRLIANPQLAREMGERGRKKTLDEWNYERQFEPLRIELERACRKMISTSTISAVDA